MWGKPPKSKWELRKSNIIKKNMGKKQQQFMEQKTENKTMINTLIVKREIQQP